ncbi:hypothetical protein BASA81_005780 [Batrachochytrium salamandrivorans]|nr:hypothetical protein BASA81_005780 [Batrachochytrium salamandrivorans]
MEAKPDFTRLAFGPDATPNVTFYGLVPPECGICVFFNQSNRFYLGSSVGLIRANPTCPKYFPGLQQIMLFPPNAITAAFEVFAFSCCEQDLPCNSNEGENWIQVSLLVTGILLAILLRKVLLGLVLMLGTVLCTCLDSRVRQPCARLRAKCSKSVCAKCGTIRLGKLCADCAPPPPFTDLGDFIAFYKQRSNNRGEGGEVDEDKVCNICFARVCQWELSCGHKLCLDCLVRSLGANPTCPFDRCAITKAPTNLVVV